MNKDINTSNEAYIDAPLMSVEDIAIKLKDMKLYAVGRATDLSYPTLQKLAKGEATNYTLDTIQKISNYFRDRELNKL